LGGTVVHELVGAIEKAAGAQIVPDTGVLGLVRDHRAAQGAVDPRQRHSAHLVDEELVPAEDPTRIGARVTVDLDPEDHVARRQVRRLAGRYHRR
jgi:hypothetical protein